MTCTFPNPPPPSHPPYKKHRDNHGRWKIVIIRKGLITKRLENLETKISETICLELTVSNKKWFILFAYRPPQENKKYAFFNELNEILSKAVNNYENVIVIGDLNIYVSDPDKDRNNYLSDFVDTFSLSNLINRKTCHKILSGTTIDRMLTNRPNCFQKTSTVVTGPPKKIIFRDYKKFDEQNFLYDLDQQMIKGKFYKEKNKYESFSDTFKAIVNKHAPQKEKIVRENSASFMTKELRKAIMNRSRLKKKYQDWPSRENFKNWKKQKNKCNKLCRKAKKDHFENITESNLSSNNKFWQFVKPFLTNKGVFGTDFISIKKDNQFINNEI